MNLKSNYSHSNWFKLTDQQIKNLLVQSTQMDDITAKKRLYKLSIEEILIYLKKSHAGYLDKIFPEMEQQFNHLYQHHRESDPIPFHLCTMFMVFKEKLKTHILNEETKLFPYINALNNLKNKQGVYSEVNELSKYSIDQFMEEHDDVESDLKVIKSLIIENSEILELPMPFKLFLIQLETFEKDLRLHAWLEDELLVHKVKNLENQVKSFLSDSIFQFELSHFINF
jgi:regulator of cell morphogenesis and NO signaling